MPLSDEHKAKMKAGRAEAARLRKEAKDATKMAAGHERDEQIRRNADSLQAQQELREEDLGVGAIDPAKLHAEPSNEAMRYAIEQRRKRFAHQSGVENARVGWHYARMKLPGTCGTEDAKSAVRQMMAQAKREGWLPVQGDDPEDKKYEGNDCAAGTSMRGYMDTVLMKIRQEDKFLMDQAQAEKEARRSGTFDAETLALAERSGMGRAYHAAQNDLTRDPFMAKRVAIADALPFTATKVTTQFTEGDIRRGSIPGMPIGR